MAEVNVALREKMEQRVQRHIERFQTEYVARNPMIPNDIFDFSKSGLPEQFEYHPVEVPNPASPLYQTQLGILNGYLMSGFQHLSAEWVSRDGRGGTAVLPDFVPIDGNVVVGGCYILFADRERYARRRKENTAKRNAILDQQSKTREEELAKQEGRGRQVRRVDSARRDVTLDQLMSEEGQSGAGGQE